MAKEKKVSISFIDNMIKGVDGYYDGPVLNEDTGVVIRIKRPSLSDSLGIIDDVINACFREGGSYSPIYEEFAFRRSVFSRLTNINMPEDDDHQWKILMMSDLYEKVEGCMDAEDIHMIRSAIRKSIKYEEKVNTGYIYKKVDESMSKLDSMSSELESIFSGVHEDGMNNIIKSLTSENFNEELFAKAIMEAGI